LPKIDPTKPTNYLGIDPDLIVNSSIQIRREGHIVEHEITTTEDLLNIEKEFKALDEFEKEPPNHRRLGPVFNDYGKINPKTKSRFGALNALVNRMM